MTDHPCVWCGLAWAIIEGEETNWIVMLATPRDHDHETIQGRR